MYYSSCEKIHVPHLVYMLVKCLMHRDVNKTHAMSLSWRRKSMPWLGMVSQGIIYIVHLSVPFDGHSLCFSISQDTKVIPNVMSLLCRRKKFALGRGFHKESWFHAALSLGAFAPFFPSQNLDFSNKFDSECDITKYSPSAMLVLYKYFNIFSSV